jgi:AcrR family transcriptional regulator
MSLMAEPSTRDRLLDAAWSEAAEQGAAALTLAGVGARAGVTRQAVYLHFANRATLLVAMARRIDETSGFRSRLAEAHELAPVEGFSRLLAYWFDYLPTIIDVALALEAAQLTGGDGADAYRDRMQDWWRGIRRAVDRLAAEDALAPPWTTDRATDWVWTSVHPATYHHLVTERGWAHHEAVDQITGRLERDLLSGGTRS